MGIDREKNDVGSFVPRFYRIYRAMSAAEWKSQFTNDPQKDFDLYLELLEGAYPQGKIERGADGELYFSLFVCLPACQGSIPLAR